MPDLDGFRLRRSCWAPRQYARWTEAEDAAVLAAQPDQLFEVARQLGRSHYTVSKRRQSLRSQSRQIDPASAGHRVHKTLGPAS
jgi:hypothetical protein